MSGQQLQCSGEAGGDRVIVDFIRRNDSATIAQLVDFLGVTATAVRQRLNRLMDAGLVARESHAAGRGRPMHTYSLTSAGARVGGNNYEDLAGVLWSEVRAVDDPKVRRGLLTRIVSRLAEVYREEIQGESLAERMASLAKVMRKRDIPFEVADADESQLPVLTALACPYPDLAEQDRGICSMEKMLFTEILGEGIRLGDCRLDGATCCTFEASPASTSTA